MQQPIRSAPFLGDFVANVWLSGSFNRFKASSHRMLASPLLPAFGEEGVFVLGRHTRQAFPTGFPEPCHWDNHLAVARPA